MWALLKFVRVTPATLRHHWCVLRRGNSISGLAKAVSSKLSTGKVGSGGNSRTGFSRFDDGQHGVELGGNARGAALP